MIDPAKLLKVASVLADQGDRSRQTDPALAEAFLRRSVSTAYYALFHYLLLAATQRFMGADQQKRPGAAILYRGFAHTKVREVCEALRAQPLKAKYRDILGKHSVSVDMQDFATAFTLLQDHRHSADYDPRPAFDQIDVRLILSLAQSAIDAFARTPATEQTDVLALLLVGARG